MLGFSVKRKRSGNQTPLPEIQRLAEIFRSVRSTDDCLALLAQKDLLDDAGLDASRYELLQSICTAMRKQGLGLEPNLLGRAAAEAILDRRLAGKASNVFGAADTDVQNYIDAADAARDRGDFSSAEFDYWRALQLFPSHAGYLVQYGHCLKERGQHADALVMYLDAHFFGAPKQDVAPHALHVAGAIGKYASVNKILEGDVQSDSGTGQSASMEQALTSRDVRTLIQLIHLRTPSLEEVAHCMCDYASRRALVLALLEKAEFARAHRDLLRMLAETGWGRNEH